MPPSTTTAEEYFWEHVPARLPGKCWEWTGTRSDDGYGKMSQKWAKQLGSFGAHRYSLVLHLGPPPEEKPLACHTCDNPPCVNPEHLYWGSALDNSRDRWERNPRRKEKTHCVRGHELTDGNIYRPPKGHGRSCKKCIKLRAERHVESNRELSRERQRRLRAERKAN